jgi:hypothetical protein
MPIKIFTQELGGTRRWGKTQEWTEAGSRKRSSSAGSEKMERAGDRQEKMEGYCSTGQSPQWAVVPMEEEYIVLTIYVLSLSLTKKLTLLC